MEVKWNTKSMIALKAHPYVDEVEAEGLDDGRFFVHLKRGYNYGGNFSDCATRSFSSAFVALKYINKKVKTP